MAGFARARVRVREAKEREREGVMQMWLQSGGKRKREVPARRAQGRRMEGRWVRRSRRKLYIGRAREIIETVRREVRMSPAPGGWLR